MHEYKINIHATGRGEAVSAIVHGAGEIDAIKSIYSNAVDVEYAGGRISGDSPYADWIVWHKA